MGKVTDQQVAELISRRILEIIGLTGLTIENIAIFAGVSVSTLRTAYRKTVSLSVDNLSKICMSFGITLTDFFDPAKYLKIEEEYLPELKKFKKHLSTHQELKNSSFQTHEKIDRNQYQAMERKLIAQIVKYSDYFDTPRTMEDMVVDFKEKHHITFTPERLYALLLKHLGSGLLDKRALPKLAQRMPASKRPYLYFKKELKKQE
ncbi:hypothetical protein [Sphingobacterium sp.]|uniref:hypothetical protein n=1 Tax=Sphingobacterium sp. TaxID=341027 RepID=UPI00289A5ED2|nr:hypothetical protein [Sphingobacterium sp.]